MAKVLTGRSGSLAAPDYWWYRARSALFASVFGALVEDGVSILEVGSADGPSIDWLASRGWRVPTDLDPAALQPGGVCASALHLPFRDESFEVVAAFDVIEHLSDEGACLDELRRVLRPGGRLFVSVPAYSWAWSRLDEMAGHHRRYTRPRLVAAVEKGGFTVDRATYAFAATFPLFALNRLSARLGSREPERPASSSISSTTERCLLGLAGLDGRWLARGDLPFGSSVLLAARR